jgi:hypothetical protein
MTAGALSSHYYLALEQVSEPPVVPAIDFGEVREVGEEGVWLLSSCKQGFSVDALRDDNPETFWQ